MFKMHLTASLSLLGSQIYSCFLENVFVQILWEHLTMWQQEPKALSVITLAIWSCIICLIMGPLIKCINRFIQDNNFNDFITNLNEEHRGNIKLKPQTCRLYPAFFCLSFCSILLYYYPFSNFTVKAIFELLPHENGYIYWADRG